MTMTGPTVRPRIAGHRIDDEATRNVLHEPNSAVCDSHGLAHKVSDFCPPTSPALQTSHSQSHPGSRDPLSVHLQIHSHEQSVRATSLAHHRSAVPLLSRLALPSTVPVRDRASGEPSRRFRQGGVRRAMAGHTRILEPEA